MAEPQGPFEVQIIHPDGKDIRNPCGSIRAAYAMFCLVAEYSGTTHDIYVHDLGRNTTIMTHLSRTR